MRMCQCAAIGDGVDEPLPVRRGEREQRDFPKHGLDVGVEHPLDVAAMGVAPSCLAVGEELVDPCAERVGPLVGLRLPALALLVNDPDPGLGQLADRIALLARFLERRFGVDAQRAALLDAVDVELRRNAFTPLGRTSRYIPFSPLPESL